MGALTFLKYVLFVLLALAVFAGISSYAQTSYDETLLPRPIPVPAPFPFDEIGVLTFYAQSDGPQAWFLYETADSRVDGRSVALPHCNAVCLKNRYGSRQVRVSGFLVNEHIAQASIASATATDDRIQFFTAGKDTAGNASGVELTPIAVGGTNAEALAWADVAHDGTMETFFFKQGTLVPVGSRKISLLYASGGTLYFAVLVER